MLKRQKQEQQQQQSQQSLQAQPRPAPPEPAKKLSIEQEHSDYFSSRSLQRFSAWATPTNDMPQGLKVNNKAFFFSFFFFLFVFFSNLKFEIKIFH